MKEFVKKKSGHCQRQTGTAKLHDHVLHGAGDVQPGGRAGNVQNQKQDCSGNSDFTVPQYNHEEHGR